VALFDNDYLDENPDKLVQILQEFGGLDNASLVVTTPTWRHFFLRQIMKRKRELMKEKITLDEPTAESIVIDEYRRKFGDLFFFLGGIVISSFAFQTLFQIFEYFEGWAATECGAITDRGILHICVKVNLEPFDDIPVHGFPFPIGEFYNC